MSFQLTLMNSMRSHAEETAIEYGKRTMTYGELSAAADAVTRFLLKENVRPGSVVGVELTNRMDMIVAVIGIINARCVFCLIDGSLPSKRLETMKKEMELSYLLVSLEAILQEDTCGDGSLPGYPDYDADDSLYIYFTSGSTGTPKGIVGRNGSLLQFVNWEIAAFGIGRGWRVSQLISPYFDAFLRDVFVPLCAGGTICIPESPGTLLTGGELATWLEESRVTLVHCVPSVFRILRQTRPGPDSLPHLRFILLSGEKIIPAELGDWYKTFGSRIQLVNLYGATETTMIRSYYLIRPEDATAGKIPIGQPIADTWLLVLDKELRPCSPLVAGDLYIVSDHITKGYLNNPELTREKFIELVVGENGKKPAFRTGDRARVLADGSIDLLGRDDRQIKLRGIRVELDEIERILLQSGLLTQAAVVLQEEAGGADFLVAFVVPQDGVGQEEAREQAIERYLRQYLPEYALPSRIVPVEAFPVLSNGKTDLQQLVRSSAKRSATAPANEMEHRLLAIWKEILGEKSIGTDESFHHAGGNSISIMRLIGRIYKEFHVRIPLGEIFGNPTIQKQAGLISRSLQDSYYTIRRAEVKPFYHLSSAQAGVYFNYELNRWRTSYNQPMAWEVNGPLDKEKIEAIFGILIDRYEILRTEFGVEGGKVVQYVRDSAELEVEELYAPDQSLYSTIIRFCRPFQLDKAPLFRCGLIRTPQGRKILVADFHHIICDGMTQAIIIEEFSKLYYGNALAPLALQYKDYAEWEYAFRQTEEYIRHREFWLRMFEGDIPQIEFPVTQVEVNDISDAGGNVVLNLPYADAASLTGFFREKDITMSAGFFAVYYLFLSQLTGQTDLVTGVASLGRTQLEVERMPGMFVKTLPVRYKADTGMSFSGMAEELNRLLIQANSHHLYDLVDIMVDLNKGRQQPIKSLVSTGFVFQNMIDAKSVVLNEEFREYVFDNPNSKNALTLYVFEGKDGFIFRLEYSDAFFARQDVELFADQFHRLILRLPDQLTIPLDGITHQPIFAASATADDIAFNF